MGKRSHGTHLPYYGRCRWSGIADPLPCHYQCEGKPAGGVDPRVPGPVGGVCRLGALAGTAPACEQPQDSLVDLAGLFRADRRWFAELPGVVAAHFRCNPEGARLQARCAWAPQVEAMISSACSPCSRLTSRWVTKRISCGPKPLARTFRAASFCDNSYDVIPVPQISHITMLVCTLAEAILMPPIRTNPSPRNFALAWSSASFCGPCSSAMSPAAARMPACRMPPPSALRYMRERSINSALPTSSDPTGAPSPLERQNMTVSALAVSCATGMPRATEALKTRAPSRCTGRPAACTWSQTSSKMSSGVMVPPAMLCVFSRETSPVLAAW